MNRVGACHLCGEIRVLQQSHVWPSLAYKRYVTDLSKGGRFDDLQSMRRWNRQAKEDWFCKACENRFEETYAASLLDRIAKDGVALTHPYDSRLLRFCVSVSWRVAKYYMPRARTQWHRDLLKKPCRRWKEFLLGQRTDVLPFSQHAMICFGARGPREDARWYLRLGGEVHPGERLVYSRVGPLIIVALLDRSKLTRQDRETWERSLVNSHGGHLHEIFTDAPPIPPLLTEGFAAVLSHVDAHCCERIARLRGKETAASAGRQVLVGS